ncbi:MAG: ISAzo13 family transposase [Anaerolineae bacterium]|nr:ISAzo13 family transposase [Anaerolineae bacterium]
MKKYYATLSEKDQRYYAAVEALKLDLGGQGYIARLLGCSEKSIYRGLKDLAELPDEPKYDPAIRKPGGGRKGYEEQHPQIDAQFLDVLKNHTAGNPMDEKVIWTDLTPEEIAKFLEKEHRIKVSKSVVNKLLKKHNYRRRKAQKKQTIKSVPNRNAQFLNIQFLVDKYLQSDNPIISFDTKKKEYLGNFYRAGHLYTREELHAYDHDFSSLAEGIIIPHGIYDRKNNLGYIHLGTSKDTSQFACDCLRAWWLQRGREFYPKATSILAQCDGGGSNGSRHYIFKEDLQRLSDELGVEIRIADYPPYCSKYNPIEHRLFPHVTRACQGVLFTSVELVQELIEKTKTSKGLKVIVKIIDTLYQTGRKVAYDFKQTMRIVHDDFLPAWNYRAIPSQTVV